VSGYNFTDRVRQTLRLAREQAALLQQEHVGPEHILLGLLEEGGGLAVTLLDELAVDRERLGEAVRRSAPVGTRADRTWPADLPYSPVAKRVLELAVTEARDLGHAYVGTEHVLLALLHRESVPAVSELERGGARLDSARAACRRLTGTGRERAHSSGRQESPRAGASGRLALVLAAAALIIALLALALVVARFGR
jgi:ATP-dependent Clp protease ATP-binding subunit ClpC